VLFRSPRFIQHVLNTDSILVNIIGCRIFVVKQNDIRMKGTIKAPADANPLAEKSRIEQGEEEQVKPVNATLLLTCQALDLNRKLLQTAVESK
jgi:hypothetical protein